MKKKIKKNEKIKKEISFPPTFRIVGGDISLKRPGFAVVLIRKTANSIEILEKNTFCVDNKTDKNKSKGELLDDIYNSIKEKLSFNDLIKTFFVREKYISSHKSVYESTIYKAVGITDWFLYLNQASEWEEMYPVTIKRLVTGNGKAEKEDVAKALEKYVGKFEYKTDDESDAMAVIVAWLIENNLMKTATGEENEKENLSL